jgi:hypothetical protein
MKTVEHSVPQVRALLETQSLFPESSRTLSVFHNSPANITVVMNAAGYSFAIKTCCSRFTGMSDMRVLLNGFVTRTSPEISHIMRSLNIGPAWLHDFNADHGVDYL